MVKYLVIRFSSIGDIVLTSPLLRCLKQQVEGAEIHFLTKKGFANIVKNNPNVSKVYTIESSIYEVLPQLKAEDYTYVIDLHYNLRSVMLKMRLNKLAFTFNKLNIKKWMLVNFKHSSLPKTHIVDRYLETVKLFGVKNDGKGLDFFIAKEEEIDVLTLPEVFHNGYVAFVIGAKHFTKRLPTKKIISICDKIKLPVLLLGGKEDEQNANEILKNSRATIYNACGKYSLQQSASLVKQATKVITHDTGLMHVAAAFNKEIISVWGNTVPEFGMTPYLATDAKPAKIIEVNGLSCRPCSKIGFNKCPRKHFNCMNLIDENEIIESVN
ncbi:MAG: glycosyltransferase family 9 protein [Bacteroidota bacterium]